MPIPAPSSSPPSGDVVNGYCTEAELREQFRDADSILTTVLLERAINAASRAIDKFCGRRFWQDATVQTRVYQADDAYLAWVDDISTSTGLIVRTDTSGDGSWATTWDAADYRLEPTNADADGQAYAWWRLVAIDDKTFPVSELRTTLQVTARFGWSAVPDEVNQACILRAAALFKRKDSPDGVAGFGDFGAVRISRFRDPDVVELLDPFRRMGLS